MTMIFKAVGFITSFLILCEKVIATETEIQHTSRLMLDLFRNYNPLIRPVEDPDSSLPVSFSLTLSQIIDLNEVNQMMKTNVWIRLTWYDYQLGWDPMDYGGITQLSIPSDNVWVPDIVLFNNADGNYEVSYKSNAVLNYTGDVLFLPPSIYISSCAIDVEYFPFDQQICEMKFSSWTYLGPELNYTLQETKLDVSNYLKSGSWDLISGDGKIEPVANETTMIVFTITIRRKSLFYIVNLIVPCILISFLNIFVFALPAGSTKIGLTINVLVSLIFFLLIISDILPPSLTIPLLGRFLIFNFLMSLIAIFISVIIINVTSRSSGTHYDMPKWSRILFLRELPKYLFITRPNHDNRWQEKCPVEFYSPPGDNESEGNDDIDNSEYTPAISRHDNTGTSRQSLYSSDIDVSTYYGRPRKRFVFNQPPRTHLDLSIKLFNSIRDVKFIRERIEKKDEWNDVRDDWKYLARVADRLLLIITIIVQLVGTTLILMNSPHVLESIDQDEILENW